uniref:Ig-like domain-containing protein n=1 Tax=Rattus norvegicus TaxID=10116 RepID=A0A8I5ZL34_RAT
EVQPGSSVKLSCKASGYTFTDYVTHLVKQRPGQGLEWIGWIYSEDGDTKFAEKCKNKDTRNTDTSSNTANMQLSSLTSEDRATYFCVRHNFATIPLVCQKPLSSKI